jgi:hypothetical protein
MVTIKYGYISNFHHDAWNYIGTKNCQTMTIFCVHCNMHFINVSILKPYYQNVGYNLYGSLKKKWTH